MKYTW
jgi:hypothetical protein